MVRKLCIITSLFCYINVFSQEIPFVVVNNSNTNENIFSSPNIEGDILTSIAPEVRAVAIDSIDGWFKINIPIDGLESPGIGWVQSGLDFFTPDYSNDFLELTATRVVLRSQPEGKLKPFSVVWIEANRDQNYAATLVGQFYAVKDHRIVNNETWFRVYLTNNCKSFRDEKMIKTLYGWLPEKYINYRYSYKNDLSSITIKELDEKYQNERDQNITNEEKLETSNAWIVLLVIIVVSLLSFSVGYVVYIKRKIKMYDKEQQFNDFIGGKYSLTNRDIEIWFLISEGFTEKQVAKKLFVSINTIKTQRTALYKKIKLINPGIKKLNKMKAADLFKKEKADFGKNSKKPG